MPFGIGQRIITLEGKHNQNVTNPTKFIGLIPPPPPSPFLKRGSTWAHLHDDDKEMSVAGVSGKTGGRHLPDNKAHIPQSGQK